MVVVRVIWQIVISLPFLRRNEQMKNPLAHPTDIRIAAVSTGARCSSECKSVLHRTSGDRAHNFLVHFTQLSSLLTANKPSNRSPSSNPIPCTSYLVPRRRHHRRQLVHGRARARPGSIAVHPQVRSEHEVLETANSNTTRPSEFCSACGDSKRLRGYREVDEEKKTEGQMMQENKNRIARRHWIRSRGSSPEDLSRVSTAAFEHTKG
jgi:hypothetical protein